MSQDSGRPQRVVGQTSHSAVLSNTEIEATLKKMWSIEMVIAKLQSKVWELKDFLIQNLVTLFKAW